MFKKPGKAAFLLTLFLFIAGSLLAIDSGSDVKSLFDRYQSVYREYREAVQNGADKHTVSKLADEMKAACQDYYSAIGVKADFTPVADNDSPGFDYSGSEDSNYLEDAGMSGSVRRPPPNPFEEELNQIMADLAAPGSEKRLPEIEKRLQKLIANCPDPEIKREAIFQLSEVLFVSPSDLRKSQEILLAYARTAIDPESRRQALARIKMLGKKAVLMRRRAEFRVVQENAINKWGSFSKSSWLALPVKIWKLGSYLTTNINRRIKASVLDRALEAYDKAVLETYPKGSTEALTRSRIVPCNRVRMLVNGRTSFHYRMEHAKRAQSSLYVQTLLFQDDETGNRLTDIMCERAQNGVDVRLILDDFFSFGKKDGVIQRLKNAGVKVLINNPILKNILKANFRSHQKLFIIDETTAIVGGMNIGSEYAKGEIEEYGWRDTDVEVQGPVVREILNLFERNWEDLTLKKGFEKGDVEKYRKAKTNVTEFAGLKKKDGLIRGPIPVYFDNPPLFEDVDARFVITFPIDEKDDNILDLFEIYLERSKREVIFESAYFIPTDRLKDAIRRACARGVEVKIITNSIESNNHPSGGWAGRDSYRDVLQAGARIFEWRGAQTIHSKVSLFDDFAVTLGAYNVNSRSHSCDSEDVIAFEDRRVARAFRHMLEKDLARCREVTLEDVNSWNKDLMKKAKMEFFNLFKFMF
ncbi:MAG: cardiolipin synthase [Clostridiales bacterium]|nr:cardiolipin synthase [Clostridiales bacterium]MDN5283327.1 cardiolipin synthase [Candidatus Ozemobacter sp.]